MRNTKGRVTRRKPALKARAVRVVNETKKAVNEAKVPAKTFVEKIASALGVR